MLSVFFLDTSWDYILAILAPAAKVLKVFRLFVALLLRVRA